MKVAIIGSSGLIGSALKNFFRQNGDEVIPVKRDFEAQDLEGAEVIINLAGAPVNQRWTEKTKRLIKESRVGTTKKLSAILEQLLAHPPRLVINASAIGYYGSNSDRGFRETDLPGGGFLAEVVQEWERALHFSRGRVIFARFGVILSGHGGALKKMLLPFKMGLGGILGNGRQYMSWLAIEDVVGAIYHVIGQEALSGPINFVSPHPVTNKQFTETLGKVLHRPTLLPVPEFVIRWGFGQMGEELLLSSAKVEPVCLLKTGYPFLYPDLEAALKKEIER